MLCADDVSNMSKGAARIAENTVPCATLIFLGSRWGPVINVHSLEIRII